MPNTPVSIFLAASTALASASLDTNHIKAGENDMGGLKEWSTDQPINAEYKLDKDAKKIMEKAKKSSACIPIGEGENCW